MKFKKYLKFCSFSFSTTTLAVFVFTLFMPISPRLDIYVPLSVNSKNGFRSPNATLNEEFSRSIE